MKRAVSVSVVLMRPLALALAASPSAQAALFAETDLTPEMLADADARVSPAQVCVGWAAATRLAGDPTLALRIAREMPPGAFGIVEYVCRSAPTLREALAGWCRYLHLLDSSVVVGLVDLGDSTALRVLSESEAPAPPSHELCFAVVVQHARAMVGPNFSVARVAFTHAASAKQLAEHRAFFSAPVEFGAKHTELVLPNEVLAASLATADPNLLAILRPTVEDALAKDAVSGLLTDQVRRAIRGALPKDDAQLETIAKKLGLTGRSLQRRLKDEGTVFQSLRDEQRKDLADRYLGQGMSFAEISFLLGFSEPSAFFRAFKRWTGLTPFERRTELEEASPA